MQSPTSQKKLQDSLNRPHSPVAVHTSPHSNSNERKHHDHLDEHKH